jgi:hypothetical protein
MLRPLPRKAEILGSSLLAHEVLFRGVHERIPTTGSPVLFFPMTMAGAIGGAQWRSPPPLGVRYGVDVDSTRLQRAHGIFLPLTRSLSDSGIYFYPLARRRRAPNTNIPF